MSVKSVPAPTARVNLFDLERAALHDLTTLVESRAAAETAAARRGITSEGAGAPPPYGGAQHER